MPAGRSARRAAAEAHPAGLYRRLRPGRCTPLHRPMLSRLRLFAVSIWSIVAAAAGLPAAQDDRALAAGDGAAAGVAARAIPRKSPRRSWRGCASRPEIRSVFVDGGRVPPGSSRCASAALIINYDAERRPQDHPARARARDLPAISRTSPTSVSGSSTKTACARSRWWSPARQQHRAGNVDLRAGDAAPRMSMIASCRKLLDSATYFDRQPRAALSSRVRGVSHARRPGVDRGIAEAARSPRSATSARRWRNSTAGDRQVPIRVQLDRTARAATCRSSSSCGCRGQRGGAVCRSPWSPTSSSISGPTSINRYDRERAGRPSPPTWSAPPRSATCIAGDLRTAGR